MRRERTARVCSLTPCIIDTIVDDLLAFLTHQIAGSGNAPTTHLSCITQSCIRITSITALVCDMYEYLVRGKF